MTTEYRLLLNGRNINHVASNLSWASNKDALGQELSFDVPFDDTKQITIVEAKPGDKVSLFFKDQLIFFGMIIDFNANGRNARNAKCFDLAFYLKSKVTIQFRKASATTAIQQLLSKFNIKTNITNIAVQITKIYRSQNVSDIIKDILDIAQKQTGNKYRFEMRGDMFVVFNWRDIKININTRWIENPQRNLSIENMKNSIEIVADNEKSTKVIASAKDDASIKYYGLLQESQTIDEKEMLKAQNVAENLLKEFNRIQESGSASFLGNYEARAGRIITLDEQITGLKGEYSIASAQHNISNGIHLMSLSLEAM